MEAKFSLWASEGGQTDMRTDCWTHTHEKINIAFPSGGKPYTLLMFIINEIFEEIAVQFYYSWRAYMYG